MPPVQGPAEADVASQDRRALRGTPRLSRGCGRRPAPHPAFQSRWPHPPPPASRRRLLPPTALSGGPARKLPRPLAPSRLAAPRDPSPRPPRCSSLRFLCFPQRACRWVHRENSHSLDKRLSGANASAAEAPRRRRNVDAEPRLEERVAEPHAGSRRRRPKSAAGKP